MRVCDGQRVVREKKLPPGRAQGFTLGIPSYIQSNTFKLILTLFFPYVCADPTVSDKDLDWLASQMGPEWESFARQQLEIPQSSIDQCKANVYPVNVQQQIFKVLAEWKRREGLGATSDSMGNKLHQCKDFQRLWHEWNERLHPN